MQTVTQKASDGYNYLASKVTKILNKIFGKKQETKYETQIDSSNYRSKGPERDDEYYIKLDEENRKNNYSSNPGYSQRYSSRSSNN